MKLLLDTHILLWALADDPKLPSAARGLILDRRNLVLFSTASIWKISIKHRAHPDKMPLSGSALARYCHAADYEEQPITSHHVEALETLRREADQPPHNDPFDRIMLAQAKADGLRFVTHDSLLPAYREPCLLAV